MSVLSARDITKKFDDTVVLRGISLDVAPGEFVGIMGASGSGKSTLLYAFSGMDTPTSGSVVIDGHELTEMNTRELAELRLNTMGFVFQHAHFLENLNVRDNIALPAVKAGHDPDVDALMERFDIVHIGDHGPSQVSGGQLQRAALCRALVTSPAILFADEPTGALNSAMTREVLAALIDVRDHGTAILMVTHDPRCASYADRVIYLRDGLIVDHWHPGPWSAADSQARETAAVEWLARQDF